MALEKGVDEARADGRDAFKMDQDEEGVSSQGVKPHGWLPVIANQNGFQMRMFKEKSS